jgi:hypothetical protein
MGAGAIKLEQDKEFLNHCSIDIGRNDAKEHIRQINLINTICYRRLSKVNTFCEITTFGEMDKVSLAHKPSSLSHPNRFHRSPWAAALLSSLLPAKPGTF